LHSKTALWEKMRSMFHEHFIDGWEALYAAIIWGYARGKLIPMGYRSG
jgi:hypothetical protein